jgi:large subunit ribosomal protein L4
MKLPVYNIDGQSVGREVELPASVFGLELTAQSEHVVYLAVKQYLANQRQGTHKSKQRNEIHGSTRKLHKQKGTGGSRKGSIKNPLYHGGGRVFGPQPRSYEQKLNKKVKRLARKIALTSKAQQGRIVVIEDFKMDAPKTKNYLQFLSKVKVNDVAIGTGKSMLVLNPIAMPVKPTAPRFPQPPRGAKKRATFAEKVKAYIVAKQAYIAAIATYNEGIAAAQLQNDETYGNIHLSSRNIPNAKTAHANSLNTYDIMNTRFLVISESALQQLGAALG